MPSAPPGSSSPATSKTHEVYPSTGNRYWSKFGVASLVKNPVYLGQARSGKSQRACPRTDRHPCGIRRGPSRSTKSLFNRAMARLPRKPCSADLHAVPAAATPSRSPATPKKTGERYPVYYCTGRYATGPCPDRAPNPPGNLDSYVEQQVYAAIQAEGGGPVAQRSRSIGTDRTDSPAAAADDEHEL